MEKKRLTEIPLRFFLEILFPKSQGLQIWECRAGSVQRFLFKTRWKRKRDLRKSILKEFHGTGKREGNLTFSITAPQDLKNTYALRDASVNWIFTVNKKESSLTEQPSSPDAPESSDPVKTGDSTSVLAMILLLVLSAALSIAYLKLKKGDSKV